MFDTAHLPDLTAVVHAVATAGVDGLDGEALTETVLEARRLREIAHQLEHQALAALEATRYTDIELGQDTAAWLATTVQLPGEVARREVADARIVARHLPETSQAWLDGRINREHVKALVDAANPRIREQIAELQDELIRLVEGCTFRYWKQDLRELVSLLDEDGPEPDDPSSTSASWTRSGPFAALKARFAGADAEFLEQIIEAKTNELFHRQQRDAKDNPEAHQRNRAELRGAAVLELLLHGHGADLAEAKKPQASISLVLRHPTATDRPVDLRSILADPLWSLTNLDGRPLALEHFVAVLCDCVVHALLVDEHGQPLRFGRDERTAPPKLRRAALIRDGGCIHAGCDRPVGWLDIHHIEQWIKGGRTDIDNLACLCRVHHALAHRRGWKLHAAGDGWFWWESPSGNTSWSQRHGRQRAGPAPPPSHLPLAA